MYWGVYTCICTSMPVCICVCLCVHMCMCMWCPWVCVLHSHLWITSNYLVTFINDVVNISSSRLNLPNATSSVGPQINALSPERSTGLLCLHTEPHCLSVNCRQVPHLAEACSFSLLNDIPYSTVWPPLPIFLLIDMWITSPYVFRLRMFSFLLGKYFLDLLGR